MLHMPTLNLSPLHRFIGALVQKVKAGKGHNPLSFVVRMSVCLALPRTSLMMRIGEVQNVEVHTVRFEPNVTVMRIYNDVV